MQYINTGMAFYPDGTPYEVIIPIRKLMDKQHVNMLHFLNADIRPLEDRVSAYIREIKGGARYDVPDAVYREFSVLHPYYSLNKANVSIFLNRVFAQEKCIETRICFNPFNQVKSFNTTSESILA